MESFLVPRCLNWIQKCDNTPQHICLLPPKINIPGIIHEAYIRVLAITSTSENWNRLWERGLQKDFLGPLFKKLGNHSSFYEWNLGSNRAEKWPKLILTSFRSLRELRASFPFISVAERQRLKFGMLEEKDANCSRRL